MNKVLDEFYKDLHCSECDCITEHHVQEFEEGFFSTCFMCEGIEEISKEELGIL